MSGNKNIERIGITAIILAVISAFLLSGFTTEKETFMEYEKTLFDNSKVHTIDIVLDNPEEFISSCMNEEYTPATVVIDGKAFKNVAIRGKGNTSLSSVASMDSDRYSFKIEFDHYETGKSYNGLDKLVLNNLIQDNTYMKDYLTYEMMREAGGISPLCSYASVTINGEEWGLYLAVEGVEESFMKRNYGDVSGNLYKPDSMQMGGGKGNGKNFGGGFSFGNNAVKLAYSDDNFSSYSEIFDSAKTDITNADKERLINSLKNLSEQTDLENTVDIESVITYFAVHNFVCNGDSYTGSMVHNYYLYEDDGKLSMLPWDYNLAFGTFMGSGATSQVNSSIDFGNMSDRPMVSWIFDNEEYKEKYYDTYLNFLCDVDIQKIITETDAMISSYVEKDATKFCTYDEYKEGVKTLSEFCNLRRKSVLNQLCYEEETIDASHINLSSMGTMSMGNKGGFGGNSDRNGEGENPERPDANGEDFSFPNGMQNPFGNGEMTFPEGMEFPFGNGEMPSPEGMENPFENGEMTMPEGMENPFENGEMTVPENESSSENKENQQNKNKGSGFTQRPDGSSGNFPSMPTQSSGNDEIILLVVSLVVLAGGLVFAAVYKR